MVYISSRVDHWMMCCVDMYYFSAPPDQMNWRNGQLVEGAPRCLPCNVTLPGMPLQQCLHNTSISACWPAQLLLHRPKCTGVLVVLLILASHTCLIWEEGSRLISGSQSAVLQTSMWYLSRQRLHPILPQALLVKRLAMCRLFLLCCDLECAAIVLTAKQSLQKRPQATPLQFHDGLCAEKVSSRLELSESYRAHAMHVVGEPWPAGHNWVPPVGCPCTKELLCEKDYRMWEFAREPQGR